MSNTNITAKLVGEITWDICDKDTGDAVFYIHYGIATLEFSRPLVQETDLGQENYHYGVGGWETSEALYEAIKTSAGIGGGCQFFAVYNLSDDRRTATVQWKDHYSY